jgi:hypothetical protein
MHPVKSKRSNTITVAQGWSNSLSIFFTVNQKYVLNWWIYWSINYANPSHWILYHLLLMSSKFYALENSNFSIIVHFMANYTLRHVSHFSTRAKNIAILKVPRISNFFHYADSLWLTYATRQVLATKLKNCSAGMIKLLFKKF